MKKFFAFILSFLLLFTNLSYADSNVQETIKELDIVDKRVNIMIKKIARDEPLDLNYFNKDIKYCESILEDQLIKMSNLYSGESNLVMKRTYSALLNTISLYELSLSSMLVYINNDIKTNYFIDTCTAYRLGNSSLNDFLLEHN